MIQTDFQITLPSTSSVHFFPQNKPSHYNTMLRTPLYLQGEWEVALMDIQYPHNWINFPGAEIAVIVKVKENEESTQLPFQAQAKRYQERQNSNRQKYSESASSKDLRNKTASYYFEHQIEYTAIKILRIPAGYYKSADALMTTFTGYFNYDELEGEFPLKILSSHNPSTKVVRLNFENMQFCDLICRNSTFFKAAGLKVEDIGDNYFYSSLLGLRKVPSELRILSTMYVYSDIIKWQRVGDNEAPLLATFPIQGHPQDQVFWGFNPPYYLPVNKEMINTIDIKLSTDEGDDFPIEKPGKVLCRLHFRRRRFNL